MWNPCDVVVVFFFLAGLVLRLQTALMSTGRLLFCVDIIYWYLRIFTILSVNKYLGPLVTMMDKMVKNMIYFVVLLLVVLVSFGVSRQAILFPDNEASWDLIKDIFFQVSVSSSIIYMRLSRPLSRVRGMGMEYLTRRSSLCSLTSCCTARCSRTPSTHRAVTVRVCSPARRAAG